MSMNTITKPIRAALVVVVLAVLVIVFVSSALLNSDADFTSAESPPQRFVFVSDLSDVTVGEVAGEATVIAELDDESIVPAASTIESIEPLGQSAAFFFVTCLARYKWSDLDVDIESGQGEFDPAVKGSALRRGVVGDWS